MKKYIVTEKQIKNIIDNLITEEENEIDYDNYDVEYDVEPETVSKLPVQQINEIIKDKVNDFLEISKDKITDPENIQKIKTFLLKLESIGMNIGKALKTKKGQDRAVFLTGLTSVSSLLVGVYQAIFNSGLADWWNPFSFELGGVGFLKLALFLFVIRLIIKAYRSLSSFSEFFNKGRNFMSNIFKSKNKNEITEHLITYQIL